LQLRRIERVLHGNQRREDRGQEKQHGDSGRDHGEPGAAEGVEQVALDGAGKPAPRREARGRSARFGFTRDDGVGHEGALAFRPGG